MKIPQGSTQDSANTSRARLQCSTPEAPPGTTRRDYTPADRAARTCWLGCPGLLKTQLFSGNTWPLPQDPTSLVQRSSKVQHPAPSASFPREQSVVSSYQK
ncbi:hypothetical protein TNCV_4268651 [Trichonephila clavipes]|nr:hypothetical protein TNCV_4268651 [Trichonephila clavipes]